MGRYRKGFRKEKWRIKKNEALNEVFFYDPYKKASSFSNIQIAVGGIKEFGMTMKQLQKALSNTVSAYKEMNLVMKQVDNLKEN